MQNSGTNGNANETLYYNGGVIASATNASNVEPPYTFAGPMVLGNSPTNASHSASANWNSTDDTYLCDFAFQGLNAAQVATLHYLIQQYYKDLNAPLPTSGWVFNGDSIGDGNYSLFNGSGGWMSYAMILQSKFQDQVAENIIPYNFAFGGNTLSLMSGTAQFAVCGPAIASAGAFAFEGSINDIHAGETAAQIEGYITAIALTARSYGASRVVWFNILPSTYYAYGSSGDNIRLAVNAWASSGTGGLQYLDKVYDVASVFTSGTVYNVTSTNFYMESGTVSPYGGFYVHPNDAGDRLIFSSFGW